METEIKIYYADTDCGGVVYYARYLEYFERARTEFFEDKGLSVKKLAEEGVLFVVSDVSAKYISPARYGDIIKVNIQLSKLKRASLSFKYEIKNSRDGKKIAVGTTKLVSVGENSKPVKMPAKVHDKLKSLT